MSSKRRNAELVKLARTFRVTSSVTDEAVLDYLSALDCPRSLTVWLLYKNGEHQQLVDLDIEPEDYDTVQRFRDAYDAWAFLSKSDFLKLDISKKDQAFKKFYQYEELCRLTNSRFRNLSLDPNYHGANVWLLNAVIQKIDKILGEFDPEEMAEQANWGPGVTTLLKGEHVSAINKFHLENGITRDLYSLVGEAFPVAYPGWHNHLTQKFGEQWACYQVGNSIVTVPKNSKTDRVIAVEPGLNLWFQKGIGKMMVRRLQRWGIDLQHQQVVNQRMAKEASETGLYATVDFSSASDSISKELVRTLIPCEWYQVLNACRSPLGKHGNKLIRWEKFSSMGNGFTFELETLIFYAAALSVREYIGVSGDITVFGDDVILPTSCYDLFSSFSEFLGFKVNRDKSFSRSYFRESCGSHYWGGVDCKPIYLKERLRNVQSIYQLANSVRWLAHRRNSHYGCDSRFRVTWFHLCGRVPKPLRFRISVSKSIVSPYGVNLFERDVPPKREYTSLGDSGFISNFDEAAPVVSRATHGIEGYYASALVELGVSQDFEGAAVLIARLRSPSLQEYGNSYTLRGRTKTRVNRVLVSQWYNLGPWI
jgi:hypothetical protein